MIIELNFLIFFFLNINVHVLNKKKHLNYHFIFSFNNFQLLIFSFDLFDLFYFIFFLEYFSIRNFICAAPQIIEKNSKTRFFKHCFSIWLYLLKVCRAKFGLEIAFYISLLLWAMRSTQKWDWILQKARKLGSRDVHATGHA